MIELLVLRVIHVLGGIFWVGSALFTTIFLMPAIATAGGNAGAVLGVMRQRGLLTVLPVVALLTMASGLRLLWIMSGGFSGAYFRTGTGSTFAAAGVAAVVSFLISFLIARPAAIRSGELGGTLAGATVEQRPGITLKMEMLRRRAAVASAVVIVLLTLASVGMAVARYVQ
jgi:uncharacterized membrane protein